MACTTKPVFHCITLVLVILATTSPKANALPVTVNVGGLTINGTAHCSPTVTGVCTTCAPLANVTVDASIAGATVGTAITAPDGSFSIKVENSTPIGIDLRTKIVDRLNVSISLPIPNCPIWANVTTGKLEAKVVARNLINVLDGHVDQLICMALTAVRFI